MQTCGVNHSRDCDPVHHEECLKNERDDGVKNYARHGSNCLTGNLLHVGRQKQ